MASQSGLKKAFINIYNSFLNIFKYFQIFEINFKYLKFIYKY